MRLLIPAFVAFLLLAAPGLATSCVTDNATLGKIANVSNTSMTDAYAFYSSFCPSSTGYTRGEVDVLVNQTKQYTSDLIGALNLTGQVGAVVDARQAAWEQNQTAFVNGLINQTKLLNGLVDIVNTSNQWNAVRAEQKEALDAEDNMIAKKLDLYPTKNEMNQAINQSHYAAQQAQPDTTPWVWIIVIAAVLGAVYWFKFRNKDNKHVATQSDEADQGISATSMAINQEVRGEDIDDPDWMEENAKRAQRNHMTRTRTIEESKERLKKGREGLTKRKKQAWG